jgi:predicted Zn-dependent protease
LNRALLSRRLRAWVLLCAAATAVPQAPAQVRLPALGESAAEEFSVSTERRLGDQIMREIRRDPAYLDDPPLLEYMQAMWRALLDAAIQRGEISPETQRLLAWELFLVRDRTVNAFALPGGYVAAFLGLIALTESTDELAAVMAHELSHVSQRHIARSIVNTQQTSVLSLVALILGVLAASRAGSTEGAQAAVVGAQAGQMQAQLNFSRDMEREADRVGYGVMTDAGYASSGVATMFEKLEAANRMNDSGAFPYLRTHPLSIERVSEARARLLASGSREATDPLEHQLMSARARVLMDLREPSLRRLQDQPDGDRFLGASALQGGARVGALYAAALAASRLNDHALAASRWQAAWQQLESLPTRPVAQRALLLLQAELLLRGGDAAKASQVLALPLVQPDSRPALLMRGQAAVALAHGNAPGAPAALRDSAAALQSWLALHPSDALAWEQLALCAEARGQRLQALRAQAEARAALGDIGGAIDRLRAAQALVRSGAANDHIEASVIDLRARELEAQRRQISAEMRQR